MRLTVVECRQDSSSHGLSLILLSHLRVRESPDELMATIREINRGQLIVVSQQVFGRYYLPPQMIHISIAKAHVFERKELYISN